MTISARWPITAATFILVQKQPVDAAATGEALKFFSWAFAKGAKDAEALDYIPMPDNVVGMIKKTWVNDIKSADGKLGLWFGAIDDLWKLGKPVGVGGPWKHTAVKAGKPSDAYLMTGYDKKREFYGRVITEGELVKDWPKGPIAYLQPGIKLYRIAPHEASPKLQ